MKKASLIIAAALLLVVGLWYVAIPAGLIADAIENALSRDYLYLKAEEVKKGAFYNFSAARVILMKKGGGGNADHPLLVFENVKGWFEFLSLFVFHPRLSFEGRMGTGEVRGTLRLTGNDTLKIEGKDISIRGMPLFEPLGVYGDGILSGDLLVRNNMGDLKFSVRDVQLVRASLGGIALPLDLFHEIKGAVALRNDTAEVLSFAMTGEGIYARVKGSIGGTGMNLSLELMTDSSFAADPFFRFVLERYKVSPGYAVIPLQGLIPRMEGG